VRPQFQQTIVGEARDRPAVDRPWTVPWRASVIGTACVRGNTGGGGGCTMAGVTAVSSLGDASPFAGSGAFHSRTWPHDQQKASLGTFCDPQFWQIIPSPPCR
jgi:hypothetical protein